MWDTGMDDIRWLDDKMKTRKHKLHKAETQLKEPEPGI